MRKIYYLIVVIGLIFVSCNKKDEEVELNKEIEVSDIITTNFTSDATLKAGKTYTVQGSIHIDGCVLTIQPGVTVKFTENSSFVIGSNRENSVLKAEGTSAQPILFTSAGNNKSAGNWNNIRFESGTSSASILSYCTIEYAGGASGDNTGAIDMNNCKVSIKNCTIKNSASRGIDMANSASFVNFTGNTIKDCEGEAIRIDVEQVHTLGKNNRIEGSDILVKSGSYNLEYSQIWHYQSAPFYFDGTVKIFFNEGSKLTISAGNTLKFARNAQLIVGENGVSGTLVANGTADSVITFTSAEEMPYNGDWNGIIFDSGSTGASLMNYCKIEYAGNDELYNANIIFRNVNNTITLSNCQINHSSAYGVYLDSLPQVNFQNNSFENNLQGNIYVRNN